MVIAARRALLAAKKEVTHLRHSAEYAALGPALGQGLRPDYNLDTPTGKKDPGRVVRRDAASPIVYHFMLGPDWTAGCLGCSFLADHLDGALPHLTHHDVTLTAVSRGPLAKIEAYKKRMGWHFPWVSSNGSSFNFDYHVSVHQGAAGWRHCPLPVLEKIAPANANDELSRPLRLHQG